MTTLADRAADHFRVVQDEICSGLERLDGAKFHQDLWQHHVSGGGRTRVLADGAVFEKAGVNFSDVAGTFPADFAAKLPGSGLAFRATGVSIVLHPRNPYVPTVHANFRYIERQDRGWFGGGADLTPYYPFREDCIHFHRVWRDVCELHGSVADHHRFKNWCDEYFFIKHRDEPRGIGGIFFDYLDSDPEATFAFVKDAAAGFLPAYVPIVERRRDAPFGERERQFQRVRRGRYVEFNLVYDRGTLFGLQTGGRIESILMSLPPEVAWVYDTGSQADCAEARLLEFLKPCNWADQKE